MRRLKNMTGRDSRMSLGSLPQADADSIFEAWLDRHPISDAANVRMILNAYERAEVYDARPPRNLTALRVTPPMLAHLKLLACDALAKHAPDGFVIDGMRWISDAPGELRRTLP
jgi:hypothetical protein